MKILNFKKNSKSAFSLFMLLLAILLIVTNTIKIQALISEGDEGGGRERNPGGFGVCGRLNQECCDGGTCIGSTACNPTTNKCESTYYCTARDAGCYKKTNEHAPGGNIARNQFDYFLPDNKCYKTDQCRECPAGSDKDVAEVRDADQSTLACESCISPSRWNEQAPQNKKCCGDDLEDCGMIIPSQGNIPGSICSIDDAGGVAQWVFTSKSMEGDVRYIPCSKAEFLAIVNNWEICDGTFWQKSVKGLNGMNHDYICQGRGRESIVECCGNAECFSKAGGARKKTGESTKPREYSSQPKPVFAELRSSHSPENIFTGTIVTITATATKSGKIEIFVDGTSKKTCDSATSCTYQRPYTTSGSHSYYATATYSEGQIRNPSTTYSFSVQECQTTGNNYRLIGGECVPSCGVIAGSFPDHAYCQINNQPCPDEYEPVNQKTFDCSPCCRKKQSQNPPTPPTQSCPSENPCNPDTQIPACINGAWVCRRRPETGNVVASDYINRITGHVAQECALGIYPYSPVPVCQDPQYPDRDENGCWQCAGTAPAGPTYYCLPNGKFSTTLNPPPPPLGQGPPPISPINLKEACEKAGYKWTGSKCCGEPEDRPEYYNDLTIGTGIITTGTGTGGLTGGASCDAPAGSLKYTGEVQNAVNQAAGSADLSSEAGVTTYLEAVVGILKGQGFVGMAHAINCNGNPSKDSIIIGKPSDQYAEYYDLVLGFGSGNPRPGIGFTERANWRRCVPCGVTGSVIRYVTGNAVGDCNSVGQYTNKLEGFGDLSDCSKNSVKYKAGRVFSNFETPKMTSDVLNKLNEAGLQANKISNDVIEFNALHEGQRVGKVDVIKNVGTDGIGSAWVWLPVGSGSGSGGAGEGGLGGCWNSKPVMSIGFVEGTQNSVVNYKGQFYGCAIDKSNYNRENDAILNLKDSHTKEQLINNKNYCDLVPDKSYYCSYTEKWLATEGRDKSHFSQAPITDVRQKAECCGTKECWNGDMCIADQSNDPLAKLGDGFRCINGNWVKQNQVCTPEGGTCGYCPIGQCLGMADNKPQCLDSGKYISDNYCENGEWSSRTKLLALKLLNMKSGDYVLFCDDRENSLNNLQYITESNEVVANVLTNLKTNNFCVLKTGDRIIAATSTDKNYEEVPGGLNIFGVTSCSAAADNGQYTPCSSSNKVWYNKKLKSYIYSTTPITVPASEISFADFIKNPINAIIEVIKRLIIPNDQSSLKAMKRFDRLYMAQYSTQQGTRAVTGSIEGKNPSSAVIEYSGFTEDICKFVEQFSKTKAPDLSKIACKKENNKYYVFAQGSEFTNINPEPIWPDLTSKLRLK